MLSMLLEVEVEHDLKGQNTLFSFDLFQIIDLKKVKNKREKQFFCSWLSLNLRTERDWEAYTVGAIVETSHVIVSVRVSCWAIIVNKSDVLGLHNRSGATIIRSDWWGWTA